jgi:hypothetical protein
MAQWYVCDVNLAGPAADSSETPNPVIFLNLTDVGGAFTRYWFFADNVAKREMLATALAAISTNFRVSAALDPPNANNNPYTQCYRLYLNKTA